MVRECDMNHDEAVAADERIREGFFRIELELKHLEESGLWRELGYASFEECVRGEFGDELADILDILNLPDPTNDEDDNEPPADA